MRAGSSSTTLIAACRRNSSKADVSVIAFGHCFQRIGKIHFDAILAIVAVANDAGG
jgi:hypothetical protein